MIGKTTSEVDGSPSSCFVDGKLNQGLASPIQQVPNPSSRAASMRFCAAKQQSSDACACDDMAKTSTKAGA